MIDEPKIQAAIARCLKFPGGRTRPDKSYPFLTCIGEQDGIGVFASLELLEAT